MNFRRALSWMSWLYGCLFGATCLGYGIAFAGHGLCLWEMPHPSPLFTALSFGSAGCANLLSGLQKLGAAQTATDEPVSAAGVEGSDVNKGATILRA
jgi:hypothetical protein